MPRLDNLLKGNVGKGKAVMFCVSFSLYLVSVSVCMFSFSF
jgi:hypothetical protein